MERKTLPKRTLLLWQMRFLIISVLCIWFCLFFAESLKFLNIVALIIGIISLAVIIWYLPVFFKGYEILLKGKAIIINYGVFTRVSHIMPYPRLIYAQSFATPLARVLKVSTVTLKAARGWIIVPEIEVDSAKEVIEYLSREVQNG